MSNEVIQDRMAKAADEMSHWAEYDYVMINTDVDHAFTEVQSILAAERLKRERQTGLSDFVRRLQDGAVTPNNQMLGGGAKKHLRMPPHWHRQ